MEQPAGGVQSITLDTAGISAIDGSGNPVDPEWVTFGAGAGAAPGAFQVAQVYEVDPVYDRIHGKLTQH